MRAKKRREEVYWNPVAFIAIEKRFLLRSLRERNIRPTFEANEYLNAMPSTFREWQHWHKTTHASSQIKAQRNIGILDYLPP